MKRVIETERLILREFDPEDAENFYRLNADVEVMKYTGDKAFNSIEESKALIENYNQYKQYGYGRWTVIEKTSGNILGWCGLKYHPDEAYTDLGYRLHRAYWKKGYATEAAKACIDYGIQHLGLKEIIGRTSRENLPSVRVLEKIGMEFWKEAPCEGIENSLYFRIKAKSDEN